MPEDQYVDPDGGSVQYDTTSEELNAKGAAGVAEIYRSIYNGGEYNIDHGDGSYTSYTRVAGPEWYNNHVKGRESLLGWGPKNIYDLNNPAKRRDYDPRYTTLFRSPPVDIHTQAAMSETIMDHWDQLEMDDPETAYLYTVNPMLLFADAEITARTNGALEAGLDTATRTGAFITGNPRSAWSMENLEDTLRNGENTSFFLDDYVNFFGEDEQSLLAYNLATVDINRREYLASLSRAWWEDGTYDPKNPEHRSEFLGWLSGAAGDARSQFQEEYGAWNQKLFNPIDATFGTFQFKDFLRRNLIPNLKNLLRGDETDWTPGNRGWGDYYSIADKYNPEHYQYTGSVPDPKQWAFETNMTTGQQIAHTFAGKHDVAFAAISASIDGFLYVATPGDLLLAGLTGGTSTASKVARLSLEPLSKVGRIKLAAKSAVPIFGRKWGATGTTVTRLPRGVMNRVGWALNSKNTDEFFDMAEQAGVYRRWFDTWAEGNIGAVLADNPSLTPLVDSGWDELLADAVYREDYDSFVDYIKQSHIATPSPGRTLNDLTADYEKLRLKVDQEMKEGFEKAIAEAGVGDDIATMNGTMIEALRNKFPKGRFLHVSDDGLFEWWDEIAGTAADNPESWNELRQVIDENPNAVVFVKDPDNFMFDVHNTDQRQAFLEWVQKGHMKIGPEDVSAWYHLDQGVTFQAADDAWKTIDEQLDSGLPYVPGGADWTLRENTATQVRDITGAVDYDSKVYQLHSGNSTVEFTANKMNYIVDFGDKEQFDAFGEPIKRFVPMRRSVDDKAQWASQSGRVASFDTRKEAIEYAFQYNYDKRLGEALAVEPPAGMGASMPNSYDTIDNGIQSIRDWFNGPMASREGVNRLIDAVYEAPDNMPLLLGLMGNTSANTGSAMTRYLEILKRVYDPNTPIEQVATDNVHAFQNNLMDNLIEWMKHATFLDEAVDLSDESFAGMLRYKGSLPSQDMKANGVVRYAENFRKDMQPFLDYFDGKDANQIRIDDLYLDDDFLMIARQAFEDMDSSTFELLLRSQNTSPGTFDIGLQWDETNLAFWEPYLFQDQGLVNSSMHILEEGPNLFTKGNLQQFHREGLSMFLDGGEYGAASLGSMADLTQGLPNVDSFDNFAGRAGAQWYNKMQSLFGTADPFEVREAIGWQDGLASALLDEYNQIQETWKSALHYKYGTDPNLQIPIFRSGVRDTAGRITSWAISSADETFLNTGTASQYGYIRLKDAGLSGYERLFKMMLGRSSHGDIANEVLAFGQEVDSAVGKGFQWRAGLQENSGIDTAKVVETFFNESTNWEQYLAIEKGTEAYEGLNSGNVAVKNIIDKMTDSYNEYLAEKGMMGTRQAGDYKGKNIGDRGFRLSADGMDATKFANPADSAQMTKLRQEIELFEKTDGLKAVVYDLPPVRNTVRDRQLHKNVAKRFNSDSSAHAWAWRKNFARLTQAAMPEQIDLTDGVNATRELRTVLKALGASDKVIAQSLTDFAKAPVARRGDVIHDSILRVGDESGNPVLRYALDNAITNARMRRSSAGVDEAGFPRDLGVVEGGFVSPTPSHGGGVFVLPDDTIFQMMGRYNSSGRLPKRVVEGLKDSTNTRRMEIVEKLRTQVGPDIAEQLGDDELLRMAYAMIAPDGSPEWDGVGAIAKWMQNYPGRAYRFIHGTFSRAVLSLQPIRWMIKVAIMEEPVRGALMGMPNFYLNPKTAGRELIHSFNLTKYDSLSAKFDDIVDSAVDTYAKGTVGEKMQFMKEAGMEPYDGSFLQVLDAGQYRTALTSYLKQTIKNDDVIPAIGGLKGDMKALNKIAKKIDKIEEGNIARGLKPDFTWDDVPEIATKSLFASYMTRIEGLRQLHWNPSDPAVIPVFSRAWAAEINRVSTDPFFRAAARYKLAMLDSGKADAVNALLADKHWPLWKQNAIDIMAAKGQPGLNGRELAEAYLLHLGDYAERVMNPLGGTMGLDSIKFNQFATGETVDVQWGDSIYRINARDENGMVRGLADMLGSQRGNNEFNTSMPRFIDAPFKETFVQHGKEDVFRGGRKSLWKRYTDWALSNFGENATMVLNRRPAYMFRYQMAYDTFTRMGMDEVLAQKAAHRKAFEAVNYVYFNNDHIPPLIKKMNSVIPFFGAQVEVLSTWFWKIPLADSKMLGHIKLYRKIDKMMAGLVNSGIVEVTFDESGPQDPPVARYQLAFDEGGVNADTLIGKALSAAGYRMADQYMRAMLGVRNLLQSEDVNPDDIIPDTFKVDLANPIDPLPGNQGLLAVNSIFAVPTPGLKASASWLTRNLSITGQNDMVEGGKHISALAGLNGVEVSEFALHNRDILIAEYGIEEFDRIVAGELDPILKSGPAYEVPGTSMYDTFIKPWLYPMGYPDSELNTWTEFVPSTLRYMARGLALGQGVANPGDFWDHNEDGTLDVNGMLSTLMLPTTQDKYQAAAQVWTSIQNAEAKTGNLRRYSDLSLRLQETMDAALAANQAHVRENGDVAWDRMGSEYEQEWNSIKAEMDMLASDILERGFRDAASTLAMRGMMGFISPATPKFVSDEQEAIAMYWESREMTEAGAGPFVEPGSGLPNLYHKFQPMGTTDVAEFNELFKAFLMDPSGKEAKQQLRNEMPELWAHAFGKTYWGRAGVPAEVQSIDDFFDQVEKGERIPFTPEVNLMRVARAHVAAEREANIIETYGDNPTEAAMSILFDWHNYKDSILDPARNGLDALEWYDDVTFDGAYADWRDRNKREDVFSAEILRQTLEFQEAVDELETLVPTLYDGNDAKEMAAQLSALSAGVSDLAASLGNEYETFGVQAERDRLISWYFDTQVAAYYGELSRLYDGLDDAQTDEEAGRLWDQIRMVNDKYSRPAQYGITAFPSVQDWRWGRLSPEEREDKLMGWVNDPVEFLNADAISRLREELPGIAHRIPQNSSQYMLFINYSKAKDGINELATFDPDTGEPYFKESQRRKAQDRLEQELRGKLMQAGLGSMVEYMDMWPIERFGEAGLLPPSVEPLAGEAMGLRYALEASGKTSGQREVVVNYIDPMYARHREMQRNNPEYAEFFNMIAQDLHEGEIDSYVVFKRFVLGRWYEQ